MNTVSTIIGDAIALERRDDGRLWAVRGKNARAVALRPCFPWSDAGRFVSLRDDDEEEFALVADPAALDDASREALELALAEAGFVMEIVAIHALDEEVEIHAWQVETPGGPRRFQTRRDDWPRETPGGGLLIRDVAGDLFWVRNPEGLDPASARRLWVFVD